MNDATIGERIRERITAAGLTHEQLADLIGYHHCTIGRWTTGRVQPGIRALKALADVFGCTCEDLVNADYRYGSPGRYHPDSDYALLRFGRPGCDLCGGRGWDREETAETPSGPRITLLLCPRCFQV